VNRRPVKLCALALSLAATLGGCGLGPGNAPTGVTLTVTREFGRIQMQRTSKPQAAGAETVMSLLMRNDHVATRYGGGFVQSINGFSGGSHEGQSSDWFYYVNGVQAPKGAASTNVHPGDRVWWDLHDWSQTEEVPAVVGSFPEPFLNGLEGKRLPVRVQCQNVPGSACQTVSRKLDGLGIPAGISAIGVTEGSQLLRVVVGTWHAIQGEPSAKQIEAGPRSSGVYARFGGTGQTLTLLGERGQALRTLGAGAGLIAATRYANESPVWMVTGTDEAGVQLAAKAFEQSILENHFAVALSAPGNVLALPLQGAPQ
jgi:hypothetical protein